MWLRGSRCWFRASTPLIQTPISQQLNGLSRKSCWLHPVVSHLGRLKCSLKQQTLSSCNFTIPYLKDIPRPFMMRTSVSKNISRLVPQQNILRSVCNSYSHRTHYVGMFQTCDKEMSLFLRKELWQNNNLILVTRSVAKWQKSPLDWSPTFFQIGLS